jgi:hypothetical protein
VGGAADLPAGEWGRLLPQQPYIRQHLKKNSCKLSADVSDKNLIISSNIVIIFLGIKPSALHC